jgi:hypothetical protein
MAKPKFNLSFRALRHLGVAAPVILALACGATLFAGYSAHNLWIQATRVEAKTIGHIEKSYLDEKALKPVIERLAQLSPDVTAVAAKDTLTLTSKDGYTAIVPALISLPSLAGNAAWETVSIQLSPAGYKAEVKAYVQQIKR